MSQAASTPLFKSIPPERVGLYGEYDYYGLVKRVLLAFRQKFERNQIQHLQVTQRGAVVVVVGRIPSQLLLVKLVNVAMKVDGARDVEINGVSVADRLRTYLEIKPTPSTLLELLSAINSD